MADEIPRCCMAGCSVLHGIGVCQVQSTMIKRRSQTSTTTTKVTEGVCAFKGVWEWKHAAHFVSVKKIKGHGLGVVL